MSLITEILNYIDYIIIAIDMTGIEVTNRGHWMQDKWKAKNNKKGY